ncbi:ogr/Delta-like zinc finger family protein [Sphingomonas sp. LT1P40]|uniref:ogr/Delta-like zinc finger family protein n=1 Tax=Alteristakelama amylovorans TaxID=3096166 RepID=UPI002FC6E925
MTTAKRPRLPGISCPHCGDRSIVRHSEQVTPIVRELRLVCDNVECGHTFVAQLTVIRTVRPSARPNPSVFLPSGDWSPPANDDAPPPANDEFPPAATVAAPPMTG